MGAGLCLGFPRAPSLSHNKHVLPGRQRVCQHLAPLPAFQRLWSAWLALQNFQLADFLTKHEEAQEEGDQEEVHSNSLSSRILMPALTPPRHGTGSVDAVTETCPQGGHHLDLFFPTPDDPQSQPHSSQAEQAFWCCLLALRVMSAFWQLAQLPSPLWILAFCHVISRPQRVWSTMATIDSPVWVLQ